MLSRLVFNSRNVLRTLSKPYMSHQAVRHSSSEAETIKEIRGRQGDDVAILTVAPPLPQVSETDPNSVEYDPKTQSLEDFLNIRFADTFPTINDDKSPSRDVKNFPRIMPPLMPERTRLYVVPNSWFEFFYEKTGVTGPYVFGAGFMTYLMSKEFFIVEHEFYTGVSLAILTAIVCKKAGPKLREWYCTSADDEAKSWDLWQKGMIGFLNNLIQTENQSQQNAKEQRIVFDAKRENIKLQLEAEFRRRQMVAYSEVRNRLEYMIARQTAERQFQQQHMVNWIISNVEKSVSAMSEKDVLQKCLSDLKQLSAKSQISLT